MVRVCMIMSRRRIQRAEHAVLSGRYRNIAGTRYESPKRGGFMWEFLMLLALGAAGVWIWSGISAHERAVAAARSVCIRHHQQLLDETVAQVRVKLFRNASGSLLPKRTYRFEFT